MSAPNQPQQAFSEWCRRNELTDETVKSLTDSGFDSLLSISRIEEEDLKAFKIPNRGQACLLKGAVREAKFIKDRETYGATDASPPPVLMDMRMQNSGSNAEQSLDDLIQQTVRQGQQPIASSGLSLPAQSSRSERPQSSLPADRLEAQSGESYRQMSDFLLNTLSENNVQSAAISVSGSKVTIDHIPPKIKVDKLTPHQWSIGNARILADLIKQKEISTEGTLQYLAYTVQINELADRFDWKSVLNYDHAYRLKIAATGAAWGSDFPFLASLHLRDKPISKEQASQKKSRGKVNEVCRLFSRGHCHYGERCIYLHTSATSDNQTPVKAVSSTKN